jgi:hypothetical protein
VPEVAAPPMLSATNIKATFLLPGAKWVGRLIPTSFQAGAAAEAGEAGSSQAPRQSRAIAVFLALI